MCLFFSLAVYLRKNQRDGGEESGPVCSTMCRQLSYPQYLAKEEEMVLAAFLFSTYTTAKMLFKSIMSIGVFPWVLKVQSLSFSIQFVLIRNYEASSVFQVKHLPLHEWWSMWYCFSMRSALVFSSKSFMSTTKGKAYLTKLISKLVKTCKEWKKNG